MTLLAIAEELWALRDVVSETDDVGAAQMHTLYNRLLIAAGAATA